MNLVEIGWSGLDWIDLAGDRSMHRAFMNAVMNLRAPSNAWKVPSGYTTFGLSSGAQLHRIS
jgi:hypothetical protein